VTYTVPLPYLRPPLSSNDSGYSVQARRARWALTKQVRADVALVIAHSKVPCCDKVRVTVHYRPRDNRRRDPQNIDTKAMLDAIVDAGVVYDDSPEYMEVVTPVIHRADRALGPALWLELEVLA
jgi:crossover junction endodeoxyribonuclease RusA